MLNIAERLLGSWQGEAWRKELDVYPSGRTRIERRAVGRGPSKACGRTSSASARGDGSASQTTPGERSRCSTPRSSFPATGTTFSAPIITPPDCSRDQIFTASYAKFAPVEQKRCCSRRTGSLDSKGRGNVGVFREKTSLVGSYGQQAEFSLKTWGLWEFWGDGYWLHAGIALGMTPSRARALACTSVDSVSLWKLPAPDMIGRMVIRLSVARSPSKVLKLCAG